MNSIHSDLFRLQDTDYKQFQCRLMPNVDENRVIGVRMPELRKYVKNFPGNVPHFLRELPHTYYEENNLHGLLINSMSDAGQAITELDRFLPYVDNWATCDLIAPCVFANDPDGLLEAVDRWMHSTHSYTVRFGIGVLLRFYLDEFFSPRYLRAVADVRFDDYYVKMMVAWYFAEALVKQYSNAIVYIEDELLELWCHNKAIQKAVESYRIPDEKKQYLRTLKRK